MLEPVPPFGTTRNRHRVYRHKSNNRVLVLLNERANEQAFDVQLPRDRMFDMVGVGGVLK
jgi:hypothetical protein